MKKRVIGLFLAMLIILSVVAVPGFTADESDEVEINWDAEMKLDKTQMQKLSGVHPRIFLNQERMDAMREEVLSGEDPYITNLYTWIIEQADSYVKSLPSVGDKITQSHGTQLAPLAFAYQMTGDEKYLNSGWEYVYELCSLLTTAADAGTIADMAYKNSFWGTALFYDWCYNALTGGQRYYILNCLAVAGNRMNKGGWWRYGWLHNYTMHCRGGAMIAGLAIYDEYPGAEQWIETGLNSFKNTIVLWPDDGTGVEGPMYSNNALADVMKLGVALNDICGLDYLRDSIFENYISYTINNSIPRNSWSAQVDQFGYGDSTPSSSFQYTGYMALLANYYQNPVAQWYAQEMLDVKAATNTRDALAELYTLLWYDKDLEAIAPAEYAQEEKDGNYYPEDMVFDDAGLVYLREDWSGDEDIMYFHCGPNFGSNAAAYQKTTPYDVGNGHVHPDQIGLMLFSNGEWLFQDDGYTTGWSKGHNVPLINGIGQLGEWSGANSYAHFYGNQGSGPIMLRWTSTETEILKTDFQGDLSYVLCDATLIYFKEENNLEHVYRHYIYSKSNKALLVIDDFSGLAMNEYQTRWRPVVQTPSKQVDGSYLYVGGTTEMLLKAFPNKNTVVKNEVEAVAAGKEGGTADALIFSQTESGLNVRLATAITWQDRGTSPLNVEMKEKDGVYTFTLGSSEIVFDSVNYTVSEYTSESEFNVMIDKQLMHYKNQPVLKNGTILVDVSETLKQIGHKGSWDVATGVYTAEIGEQQAQLKAGSRDVSWNGETFTVLENAEVIGGVFYAPVRAIAQITDVLVYYDESAKCAVLDSTADKTNAEIFNMSVNGDTVLPDENGVYTTELYGDTLDIQAVAAVKGANISIDKTEGVFGTSTVYITSADGKNTNQYTVETKPKSTIGNLPVYNITSPDAMLADIKHTVDKSFDTAWAISGVGASIVYDLGQICNIDTVHIGFLHGASRRQIVTILVSDDNVNFTEVFSGKASGTTTTGDNFEVKTKGRYVKIVLGGHTNGGGWNNTSEVGVTGSY